MSDTRWTKVGMCDGPAQATHNDICDGALKHYEKLSNNACSWMNTVPKAIEFYRKYGPGPLLRLGEIPEVKRLVEALKRAENYITEAVPFVDDDDRDEVLGVVGAALAEIHEGEKS